MTRSKKSTGWSRFRKFVNDIHLWLGLASGLIVIAVCFSGTVYVFNSELKEIASPGLYELKQIPEGNTLPAEEIIAKVEAVTKGTVQSLKVPADKTRTWQISVRKNSDRRESRQSSGPPSGPPSGRPNMGTLYAVDPFTGEVIGDITNDKNAVSEFMRSMFSLHRWLLLDRIEEPIFGELPNRKLGSYITGTATILFTLGVLTGLIIWFPRKLKNWKQGLTIKWNAKWKRVNHDLHNTLAFYSLIFLLIMGVTGPQWSFPWYREGLQKTLGTYRPEDAPRPKPAQSRMPATTDGLDKMTIAAYLMSADKILNYAGDYTIVLPADSSAAVNVSKNSTGFFAPSAADKLSLDQYTGEVTHTDIFKYKPFNERVAGSIKALHVGDVYGMFTKIIYFLACLVATSLPVTGTIIWINKLRKKRHKAASNPIILETEKAGV